MHASRTVKTAGAVSAGIVLLTAAGGTFAQWGQSEDVDAGSISAGHLSMTVTNGTWYDTRGTTSTSDDQAISDPSSFRIVPGDTIEYRATVDPDVVGDNLRATLSTSLSTATGALAQHADTAATLDGADTQTLTPGNTSGGKTFDAVVKVAMPKSATGGQNQTLDLTSLEISLEQVTS